MEANNMRKWWREIGARLVNRELIELIGQGIGYVPLMNLLGDITDLPESRFEDIVTDLVLDGLTLKQVTYQGGKKELLLYIK